MINAHKRTGATGEQGLRSQFEERESLCCGSVHPPLGQAPDSMYYGRLIDDELARTIVPGGELSWLMGHVRSEKGCRWSAHVQFRRDRGKRRNGSVQLYWGRTSPLEFILLRNGRVRLSADSTYKDVSKQLFSEPVAIDPGLFTIRLIEARILDDFALV